MVALSNRMIAMVAKTRDESIRKGTRQIVGFSLPPAIAREAKAEAARRGLSLRGLFEEMWSRYQKTKPANAKP